MVLGRLGLLALFFASEVQVVLGAAVGFVSVSQTGYTALTVGWLVARLVALCALYFALWRQMPHRSANVTNPFALGRDSRLRQEGA